MLVNARRARFPSVLRHFALKRGLYACSSCDFSLGCIGMARSSADMCILTLLIDRESESLITLVREITILWMFS